MRYRLARGWLTGYTPAQKLLTMGVQVVLGAYGKSDEPANFSHWWLELPTGRVRKGGRMEYISCESYPGASVYFQAILPSHGVTAISHVRMSFGAGPRLG